MFRTLTLNPSLDAFHRVPRLAKGRVLRVPEPLLVAGGKGVNVARHLARLGGRGTVVAHCLLGGTSGERFLRLAKAEAGLQIEAPLHKGETRTNLSIAETEGVGEFKLNAAGPRWPGATWMPASGSSWSRSRGGTWR